MARLAEGDSHSHTALLLGGIADLLLPEGRDFLRLNDAISLTTQPRRIDELLDEGMQAAIGGIETTWLRSGVVVAYGRFDLPDDTDLVQEMALLRRIDVYLTSVLFWLWVIRDSSARSELLFLRSSRGETHSNVSLAPGTTNCIGERNPVQFSKEEISRAADQWDLDALIDEELDVPVGKEAGVVAATDVKMTQAVYFIQAARATAGIGTKIANLCTALESLLSSDDEKEGLSHKLAERVAWLLAGEKSEADRISLYGEVKKMYGVRSSVVHGVRVKPSKAEQWESTARSADNIVRAVVRRLRSLPDEEARLFAEPCRPAEFNRWALSLSLGGSRAAERLDEPDQQHSQD